MNCRQADKWIDQALDGALGSGQKALLDAHFASCPQCRKEWEVLRAADAALRAPRPVRAPHGLLTEFRERLAQEEAQQERRQEERRRAWPWFWPVASFAAAGATAALVVALNLAPAGSPLNPPPTPDRREMAKSEGRDPEIDPPRPAPAVTDSRRRPAPSAPDLRRPRELDVKAAEAPPTPAPRVSPPTASEPRRTEAEALAKTKVNRKHTSLALGVTAGGFGRRVELGPAGGAAVPSAIERVPRLEPGGGAFASTSPPLANFESRVALRNGNVTGVPIALEADVQQVQSEVLPAEFNVSPAVLTALRRDVEVSVTTVPVREALRRITETADVVVKIDASVQPLRVTLEQDGEPLWVALQKVAQQGKLQIIPEANHLVLRPEMKDGRPLAARLILPYGQPSEPGKKAMGGLGGGGFIGGRAARAAAPDRAVWPADWGTLPERGFQPPGPEELPASVAGLPQAMDEVRLENRYYQNGLQNPLQNNRQRLPSKPNPR